MRALILALGITLAATPALAQVVIGPCDSDKHIRETVTVEGFVSKLWYNHITINLVMDCSFEGIILRDDSARFPDWRDLWRKTIAVTGQMRWDKGGKYINLFNASQLKLK